MPRGLEFYKNWGDWQRSFLPKGIQEENIGIREPLFLAKTIDTAVLPVGID